MIPFTKFLRLLPFLFSSISISLHAQTALDSVRQEMKEFIGNTDSKAGLLFGMYDEHTGKILLLAEGAIQKDDDLRVACPTTKPCVSYMTLKENVNIDASIAKWFPVEDGYSKADIITPRMLLYNRSGIKDFARIVRIDPYHKIAPIETIDLAYRNQPLEFPPDQHYQYSNTNYNIVGVILERKRKKSFGELIKEYFGPIAPSLRLDDGRGRYPKGYPDPWPYHWSTTGYAGGLIATAEDAMKVFSFISNSPEFKIMTEWKEDQDKPDHLVGMGIFAFKQFHDFGRVVYYDGDMMVNQMLIMKIDHTIYYFHTTHQVMLERLINFSYKIISLLTSK